MTTASAVHTVMPDPRDLLAAIEAHWGRGGWFRCEREPRLCFAACPACKSKPLRREHVSAGYPLMIQEFDGGHYRLHRLCLCSEEAIVAALAATIHFDFETAA